METFKVIMNTETNKYFAGSFWERERSWVLDIKDAHRFYGEIESSTFSDDESCDNIIYSFSNIQFLEVKTIIKL